MARPCDWGRALTYAQKSGGGSGGGRSSVKICERMKGERIAREAGADGLLVGRPVFSAVFDRAMSCSKVSLIERVLFAGR